MATVVPSWDKTVHDRAVIVSYQAEGLAVERIGNLLDHDLPVLPAGYRSIPSLLEVAR